MGRPRAGSELSLSQLEQMLADRRSQISSLERERTQALKHLREIDLRIKNLGGHSSAAPRGAPPGARVKNDKSLAETIQDVLSGGGAKGVGEIVDSVLATGYKTNARNFRNIVNQVLIKDDRFASPVRAKYQLKK